MNAAHLDYRTEETLGHRFYRVNNDINGNPRYVISWLAFETEGNGVTLSIKDLEDRYQKARKLANSIGFKVYRGKDFGGGFICQSYNLENTAEQIIETRGE